MNRNPPPLGRDINALIQIMQDLRTNEIGCPWDIKQTFETIAPFTIEEAYEVADAIDRADMDDLKNELGDLLLQVVYHAQIAGEDKHFNFDDVVAAICDKMIRRHPHVYGENGSGERIEVKEGFWEDIKGFERKSVRIVGDGGILDGVAATLPALSRALKLQCRAARVGFEWPNYSQVIAKINEEAVELEEACHSQDGDHITEEMGDLLFACANLARHVGVDPEDALRKANQKFTHRFGYIETQINLQKRLWDEVSMDELEELWCEAKKN
jgi:MazG family protein